MQHRPTVGESYLDFIGVPRDYRWFDSLAAHLSEEINATAARAFESATRVDPLLRALSRPGWSLWTPARVELGKLRPGSDFATPSGDHGFVDRAQHHLPDRVDVSWDPITTPPDWMASTQPANLEVIADVPVPLDLSPLLAPTPPPRWRYDEPA